MVGSNSTAPTRRVEQPAARPGRLSLRSNHSCWGWKTSTNTAAHNRMLRKGASSAQHR